MIFSGLLIKEYGELWGNGIWEHDEQPCHVIFGLLDFSAILMASQVQVLMLLMPHDAIEYGEELY